MQLPNPTDLEVPSPAARGDALPAFLQTQHLGPLFDHSPTAIVIVTADRQFRRANPQACRFLGYTEDELQAMTFLDITHPDDLEVGEQRTRELLAGMHDSLRFKKRYIHKKGHVLWADVVINTVRDESGEPQCFISQIIDISAQHAAETALRESEERYRSLVEEQTDIISRCTTDYTITFVNEAYCRQRNMTREELIGTRFIDLLPPDRRANVCKYFEDLLANPRVKREETRVVRENGTVHWHQWIDSPVFDESGSVVEIQSVGRDITARKQAELELKRKAALEQMLFRELDHRVRNNLVSLLSLVDITRDGAEDIDTFTNAIRGRIKAMATVHGLLSQVRTSALSLRQIGTSLIPPESKGAVTPGDIDIRIAARQVSSIGMLIHEMMTNSCKHGALGESTGHVRIDWTVSHDPSTARQHVTMTWTETGGPTPQPGPRRVGLDLVQGLAQAELGGIATIDFPPTGATAHFTFALDPIGAMTPAS